MISKFVRKNLGEVVHVRVSRNPQKLEVRDSISR